MNFVRFLPLALFAGLSLLLGIGLYIGNPQEIPSVFIDEPAPQIDLAPLPGYKEGQGGLTNDLFTRGQVSVVNVWASWCAPCRNENPALIAWARTHDVPIYGFNYKDETADALAFLRDLGDPFTAIGVDPLGRTGIDWGVYGVPETFVIDGNGRVVYKHVGPLDAQSLRSIIEPAIEEAEARTVLVSDTQ
ncbi:MAG: DsbE family thiol:disulfide interchange protein [Alphaproteobacteria bacterium]|nr:MAG: DsbE family thiol:disulfide interchange protein [Alphaproteobacteria bacterium]